MIAVFLFSVKNGFWQRRSSFASTRYVLQGHVSVKPARVPDGIKVKLCALFSDESRYSTSPDICHELFDFFFRCHSTSLAFGKRSF